MLKFFAIEKLGVICDNELSFIRLCVEFSKNPAPETVYIISDGILQGVISREIFNRRQSDDIRVGDLILHIPSVTLKKWQPNKKNVKKANKAAFKRMLLDDNLTEVAITHNDGRLIGTCVKISDVDENCYNKQLIVMSHYLELAQKNVYCISEWLVENGYRKVAYYARFHENKRDFSALDIFILSEMASKNLVNISGIVTQNLTSLNNYSIITPEDVDADDDIQAVLVPDFALARKAQCVFEKPIVNLATIIEEIYRTEILEIQIIKELVRLQNKGHKVLFIATPEVAKVSNRSDYENFLLENKVGTHYRLMKIFNDSVFEVSGILGQYKTMDEFKKCYCGKATTPYKDYFRFVDNSSQYSSFVNSYRGTTDQPENPAYTIHVFGNSVGVGLRFADKDTSSSYLQRLLNANEINARVENKCINAMQVKIIANHIRDTKFGENDIVVVLTRNGNVSKYFSKLAEKNGIEFFDTQELFERPHSMGEVFMDLYHPNFNGNRIIAEQIYKKLASELERLKHTENCSRTPQIPETEIITPYFGEKINNLPFEILEPYYNPVVQSADFKEYINNLNEMPKLEGVTGAIVMNCNPFTLGHRYLIEIASQKLDNLYIFVVEEDKSIFPFADRIELVCRGTADLANVKVFPSGRFIISALTFKEYFEKSDLQEQTIDPSQDIELFAEHIAPSLGITVRFAGEEPFDKVTLQYNQTMAQILPEHGIDFEVIPRKEVGGAVISASRVRKLLETESWDEIAEIVPISTLKYLKLRANGKLDEWRRQKD